MTVVLEAQGAHSAPAIPQADDGVNRADTLEEMIGAHRMALLDLAPRQDERAARVEAAWHMEELGMLLRVRDGGQDRVTQNAAPGATEGRERPWENTSTDRRRR